MQATGSDCAMILPVPESLAGRLLIATPMLNDPNFERTVVLVLEHTDDGAVGLVLNRPTELEFVGSVERWEKLAAPPAVVFVGGPVSQSAVIVLGRRVNLPVLGDLAELAALADIPDIPLLETPSLTDDHAGHGDDDPPRPPWTPIAGDIGVVDLSQVEPDTPDLEIIRVFMGYAGWSASQLEAEIDEGAWFVVDCQPDDPLTADPDDLWGAVLRRQPGRLKWFARYPDDPSMN